jgi:hypothetical protein
LKLAASGDQPVIPPHGCAPPPAKKNSRRKNSLRRRRAGKPRRKRWARGNGCWRSKISRIWARCPTLRKRSGKRCAGSFSFLRLEGNKLTAKVSVSGADPAQALGGLPFFTPGKVECGAPRHPNKNENGKII